MKASREWEQLYDRCSDTRNWMARDEGTYKTPRLTSSITVDIVFGTNNHMAWMHFPSKTVPRRRTIINIWE